MTEIISLPRSGKLPVLNLLTGQKSFFFAPQGRLLAPIHVKLGTADGHLSPLGCAKFHLNLCRGGNVAPKIKIFHFLVKSLLAGANPFTDFYNFYGLLYAHLSYISISNLTRFASQVTELLLRNHASIN